MIFLDKLLNIQKDVLLAQHTTFRIGGPAKYFYETKNSKDLLKAVEAVRKAEIPFFVLGGGSNILVSDKGFDGIVIKVKSQKSKVKSNIIYADSGILLSRLVIESIGAGLTGLEWAMGIPGTVGGAARGNAGAFGHSISEAIEEVKVMDLTNQKVRKLVNKDCEFSYRGSIFKQNKNLIILSVELKLEKEKKPGLGQEIIKKCLEDRKKSIPPYPSAGSIFKNLEIANLNKFAVNAQKFLKMIPKEKIKGGKIPTGFLIEQCGLKEKKIGGAMISEKHSNFIVNVDNAKARDVVKLINLCKEQVKDKFGIELEEEIEYLGEF